MEHVIAMSGPIAVGKSAVISELERYCGAIRVSTRSIIQSLFPEVPTERGPLQAAGERLDRQTDGKWVMETLAMRESDFAGIPVVVVDSIRIQRQLDHLRERFGHRVSHVHLTARLVVLEARFNVRKGMGDPAVREFATYAEAKSNPTEAAVEALAGIADQFIDTSDLEPAAVAVQIMERVGIESRR